MTSPPFEYCALRFLIQWEQNECKIHKEVASTLSTDQIRYALRYFQVARNFKGLKSDEVAKDIIRTFDKIDLSTDLSPAEKVDALASKFKKKFNQQNLSASSKLFWLRHKKPYVIYDSRAVRSLQNMGLNFNKKHYSQYRSVWIEQYEKQKMEIRRASRRLPEIRSFLPPWHSSKRELTELVSKEWFLERVFDIYLWELGGNK